jgi:2'-hydroxyisoflavone reductase
MSTDRRDFLRMTALASGALAVGVLPGARVLAQSAESARRQTRALRILFLGGTSFIGPHMVQNALDRGHTVTLFNRGQTNPALFPGAEKLRGDRSAASPDVKALVGRKWDVVIDTSAQVPEWVDLTGKVLTGNVGQYLFISTRSVYADTSRVPMTIDAPLHTRQTQPPSANGTLQYGVAKAECEGLVQKYFGDRFTIIRPGIIMGPGDDTDRFTYWPVRIERGGEVLSPGDGKDPVQIIDARDLGQWVVKLVENKTLGIYNGVGPRTPRPYDEFLYGIKAATTSECTFTWVDADFLAANRVRAYQEMPIWRPARGAYAGFARFDLTREVAAGLTFRPLADSVRDTLKYYHSLPRAEQDRLNAGITPAREAEVLKLWHARPK